MRELMAGVGVGRTSTWDSPEVKAKPKMPADWYQAYQASLKIGRQGLPEIVGVTEYRDIIGVAIQKAIEGAPAGPGPGPGAEGVPGHAQPDRELAPAPRRLVSPDLSAVPASATAGALAAHASGRLGRWAPPARPVALPGARRAARGGDHRLPDRLHGVDEPPGVVRLEPDRRRASSGWRTTGRSSSATRASGRRWSGPSTSRIVAVAAETILGVAMALLFNREFWGRGLLRTLAILPMVATPIAIALVFVMMYHPTLGVANYLLPARAAAVQAGRTRARPRSTRWRWWTSGSGRRSSC